MGDHLTIFWDFLFGVDSISEEVAGFFSIYGFLEEKHCVHCILFFIVVLVVLSFKDTNDMIA